jgi:hypothetical protein
MDNAKVWVRLGATVRLNKPLKEFKTSRELEKAMVEAIRRNAFEVDGDTYIPDPVMDDVAEEAGFEWEGGDLELGDL